MDAQRVIPAHEFLYAGRRRLGIEEHLAATCPACGAADANTRHARLCYRAGAQVKPQPAVGLRNFSLPEADVRPRPSGKLCTVQRQQGPTYGHRYREGRPPKRVGIECPTQKHIYRRRLRGPPSGGSPAWRTCLTEIDQLLQLLRRESTIATARLTCALRRAHP